MEMTEATPDEIATALGYIRPEMSDVARRTTAQALLGMFEIRRCGK